MEALVHKKYTIPIEKCKQYTYRDLRMTGPDHETEETAVDSRNWNPATPNLLAGQEQVVWAVVIDADAAHVACAPDAAPDASAAVDASAADASAVAAGVVSGGAGVVVPSGDGQRPLCGCT